MSWASAAQGIDPEFQAELDKIALTADKAKPEEHETDIKAADVSVKDREDLEKSLLFAKAWRLQLPMRTPYPSHPKKQQNLWWNLYPPTPNHSKFAISMNFERSSLKFNEILRKNHQHRFEKRRIWVKKEKIANFDEKSQKIQQKMFEFLSF